MNPSEDKAQAPSVVHNWQDAEALAAWHMRQLGFSDAEVTPPGADKGLDVVSTKAVAQVKHYAGTPVGAPAVQQLRGAAHGAEWILFYSYSNYTKAAISFAEEANVALFVYDETGSVRAQNEAASFLLRDSRTPEGARIDKWQLEREAQELGQKYFDSVTSQFFEVVNAILADAQQANGHTVASRAALAEVGRVEPVIVRLGGQKVPLEVFMRECQKIVEASDRLRELRR